MYIGEYLQSQKVPFELMLHQPAPSSTRLAQMIHVPGRHVAKTVLVWADDGYVLTVLPATHRVSLDRLAAVLGATEVRLATEDEVEQVFNDCERGALPPFGRLYGLKTMVDTSLPRGSELMFEGNLRHEGLRMRYRDYEAIEAPQRARFATPIAPQHARATLGLSD